MSGKLYHYFRDYIPSTILILGIVWGIFEIIMWLFKTIF